MSEENIDRLENLDADAVYRLLSEEATDGRWEMISHVPSEDGGLGDIFVSGRADCQWAFGGAVKFSLRLRPNPDTEVYPPGEYYTRYTRYGLERSIGGKVVALDGNVLCQFLYRGLYGIRENVHCARLQSRRIERSGIGWTRSSARRIGWDEELSEADAETGDFSLDVSSVLDGWTRSSARRMRKQKTSAFSYMNPE